MEKVNQWKDISPWVASRILEFFNSARSAKDITDSNLLMDDPNSGSEHGTIIGPTVAQRILEMKSRLPGRRFRNIFQLEEISGLGSDKINDLNYSFGKPADKAFVERLRSSGTLLENWEIEAHSDQFSEEDFQLFLRFPSAVRSWATEKIIKISKEKDPKNYQIHQLIPSMINQSYADVYEDGHMGSFAFAFWLYHFDQDNWFSFEMIRKQVEYYLNYYPAGDYRLAFHMYRGFRNAGILIGSVEDLPIVLNRAERRITIWAFQLND